VYLFGLFNKNKVRITSILRGSDKVTSRLAPFSASGFIVRRLKDTNNEKKKKRCRMLKLLKTCE